MPSPPQVLSLSVEFVSDSSASLACSTQKHARIRGWATARIRGSITARIRGWARTRIRGNETAHIRGWATTRIRG